MYCRFLNFQRIFHNLVRPPCSNFMRLAALLVMINRQSRVRQRIRSIVGTLLLISLAIFVSVSDNPPNLSANGHCVTEKSCALYISTRLFATCRNSHLKSRNTKYANYPLRMQITYSKPNFILSKMCYMNLKTFLNQKDAFL